MVPNTPWITLSQLSWLTAAECVQNNRCSRRFSLLFIGVRVGVRILREVKGQHFADDAVSLLRVHANERVSLGVKLLFERDDNGLEVLHRLVLYVVGHLANVCVVQGSINLIQDKEWSRLVAVYSEEQGQGSDSLLSSRQVIHRPESLPWSHTVVVYPI
uniref:Uncharacterized protein n=1 Tax=Anguilla anguilla TaxID=7936 RepID=A0A0E9WKZ7_ANGAN